MFYFRRRDSGFSILEMVVAVTILTIVVSLFYLYNNKGMRFYDKILNFDRVQINAKSSMETIINNLREASKEYIFVGSGYNSRVPLPEDIIISEPYVYFAKFVPDSEEVDVKGIKDKIARKVAGHYDYYLLYLAKVSKNAGEYYTDRARLKFLIFTNQTIENTDFNAQDWPFLPIKDDEFSFSIFNIGVDQSSKSSQELHKGFLEYIQLGTQSPTFSISDSEIEFDYFNSNNVIDKEYVFVKIVMKDIDEKVILNMETAIMPRN